MVEKSFYLQLQTAMFPDIGGNPTYFITAGVFHNSVMKLIVFFVSSGVLTSNLFVLKIIFDIGFFHSVSKSTNPLVPLKMQKGHLSMALFV